MKEEKNRIHSPDSYKKERKINKQQKW